ncbi:unnamed protein product [Brassica oleracea var. botrytis]
MLTRSSKHDIVYVGMEVRTAFNIVSFPALERRFDEKLTARCRILSTMAVKRSFLRLPKCSGD